ncbi:hypothetical protein PFISCL1PPCAC_10996, partial [Pristionchus fissidentatus]
VRFCALNTPSRLQYPPSSVRDSHLAQLLSHSSHGWSSSTYGFISTRTRSPWLSCAYRSVMARMNERSFVNATL